MDRESPESYMEPTAQGLEEAEEFVKYTLAKKCSRIYPCITPRFIPTCTMESMKGSEKNTEFEFDLNIVPLRSVVSSLNLACEVV